MLNNAVAGGNFMQGVGTATWQGALMGGVPGAISGGEFGYYRAKATGANYFWGTKPENWAYNRSQWSLAWWDKPDVIKFDVHNSGQGLLNCRAKCFEDMFGNSEEYWWRFYKYSDKDVDAIRAIRSNGGDVMQYHVDDAENVNFNTLQTLQSSNGKALYTVENYNGGIDGHAMVIKQIKYCVFPQICLCNLAALKF